MHAVPPLACPDRAIVRRLVGRHALLAEELTGEELRQDLVALALSLLGLQYRGLPLHDDVELVRIVPLPANHISRLEDLLLDVLQEPLPLGLEQRLDDVDRVQKDVELDGPVHHLPDVIIEDLSAQNPDHRVAQGDHGGVPWHRVQECDLPEDVASLLPVHPDVHVLVLLQHLEVTGLHDVQLRSGHAFLTLPYQDFSCVYLPLVHVRAHRGLLVWRELGKDEQLVERLEQEGKVLLEGRADAVGQGGLARKVPTSDGQGTGDDPVAAYGGLLPTSRQAHSHREPFIDPPGL